MSQFEAWFSEAKSADANFDINDVIDIREESFYNKSKTCVFTRKGMGVLHYAALYGKSEIVEFLLKNGAGMLDFMT